MVRLRSHNLRVVRFDLYYSENMEVKFRDLSVTQIASCDSTFKVSHLCIIYVFYIKYLHNICCRVFICYICHTYDQFSYDTIIWFYLCV